MGIECVYTIECPNTKNVVYVGATKDFEKRVIIHLSNAGSIKTNLANWILRLKKVGEYPIIKPIDDDASFEKYWIHQMRSWGMPLLNSVIYKRDNLYDPKRISKRNNFTLSDEAQEIINTIKNKSRYVSEAIVDKNSGNNSVAGKA